MAAPASLIPVTCPRCQTRLGMPPGIPAVRCSTCGNIVNAPPPSMGGYGGSGPPPPGVAPAPRSVAPPPVPPRRPDAGPDLGRLFMTVDVDRSGAIDGRELQMALSSGGWKPFSARSVDLMIAIFDRDSSKTINYSEFQSLWKYLCDWRRCFDTFDTDRSGSLDFGEVKKAIETFGYRLPERCVALLFRSYDEDRSGSMGFDEFIQLNAELNMLTNVFRTADTDRDGRINLTYEGFIQMFLALKI